VLIFGEGDGRFLERLLKAAPEARVDVVDSSARMLELARARGVEDRVRYFHMDARRFESEQSYDLVVTHFFLDCFVEKDVKKLVERLSAVASTWLISEFRNSKWGGSLLWVLYTFFRITTGLEGSKLTDHRPLLTAHGFEMQKCEESWFGLLSSEFWVKR
jgi:SAM-dependent methyltransferase